MKSYNLLTDNSDYEENVDYDKYIEQIDALFESKIYKEFKKYELREDLINFYIESSKYICENIMHIPNDSLLLYLTEEETKKEETKTEDSGFIKWLRNVGKWIENAWKTIGNACARIFTDKGRKAAETLEEKSKKYDEVVKTNETLQNQLNTLKGQNSASSQPAASQLQTSQLETPKQNKQEVQQMQSDQPLPEDHSQQTIQPNSQDIQKKPQKKGFVQTVQSLFSRKPKAQQVQTVQTIPEPSQQDIQQQDQSSYALNLLNSFYTWVSQLYKEINTSQSETNEFNSSEIQEKINKSKENTKDTINSFFNTSLAIKLKSSENTKNNFNSILSLLEQNASEVIKISEQSGDINYKNALDIILGKYNNAKQLISEIDELTSKGDKTIVEYTAMYKSAVKYLLLVTSCFAASYFGTIILTKSSEVTNDYKINLCEAITYTNYLYSKIVKDTSFLIKYKNVIKDNNEYIDTVYFRFGQIIILCLATAINALTSILTQTPSPSSAPTPDKSGENHDEGTAQWRKQSSIVTLPFTDEFKKAFGENGNINSIMKLIEDAGFSKNLTLDKIIEKAYNDIKNLSTDGSTNNLYALSLFFKSSIDNFNNLWENIKNEINKKGSSDQNDMELKTKEKTLPENNPSEVKKMLNALNSYVIEENEKKQKGFVGTVKQFFGSFLNGNKNKSGEKL